jgi:hypothetical protein
MEIKKSRPENLSIEKESVDIPDTTKDKKPAEEVKNE